MNVNTDVIKVNVVNEKFNFWNALKIYYEHPNSINKQIIISKDIFSLKLKSFTRSDCYNLYNELFSQVSETFDVQLITEKFSGWILEFVNSNEVVSDVNGNYLLVRRLIPKLYTNDSTEFYEFIFCDKKNLQVYIFTKHLIKELNCDLSGEVKKQDPLFILKFTFLELLYMNNNLEVFYDKNLGDKGINWLKAIFIPKFMKLVSNTCNTKSNKSKSNLLYDSKVDIVQYYKFYERMKSKYAKYLIDNWTENTDPKKFVFEDIGIATYLMMLWNGGNVPDVEAKKEKFVDLGCGNGLLVYILNSEGHLGVGLDIRKRKIWDAYPPTTVLKEETIIPTANTTYPEADWLIGNHSDELTAWIPVMARRSNRHCHYFVLPCCPFQLNGKKFQRKNSGLSSYHDFIGYVKDISQLCDFETYVDKLRIPSTKRICLIGLNKPEMSEEKRISVDEAVTNFIAQECQLIRSTEENEITNSDNLSVGANKALEFKVRDSVEKVRNCTTLSQDLIDRILKIVMHELLKESFVENVVNSKETHKWNRGAKLEISKIAACIDEKLLKQLKNECKGLQTLLKNHHFLFEVGQGSVQFRSPENMQKICSKFLESQHRTKWKRKSCWLFSNHPDKCPLPDDKCSYSHDK